MFPSHFSLDYPHRFSKCGTVLIRYGHQSFMSFEAAVRGMNVDSGLTAALIDVVFHQRNDLLELLLQLSASSRRARVQRAHHLRHTHTHQYILTVYLKSWHQLEEMGLWQDSNMHESLWVCVHTALTEHINGTLCNMGPTLKMTVLWSKSLNLIGDALMTASNTARDHKIISISLFALKYSS